MNARSRPSIATSRRLLIAPALVAVAALVVTTTALEAHAAPSGSQTSSGPVGQTLTVSPAVGLDPNGATVHVTGTGYDTALGIYVAFCVDNGPTQPPSPCVGGVDTTGTSGSAKWVSSNPPPYGVGIATPFGPGGTFAVDLTITAQDNAVNCLDGVTVCKILTRADHTHAGDRSADVKLTVSFATPSGSSSSTTTTTTTSTIPPTTAAPVSGPNGSRTATGPNGQSVTVQPADDLAPVGAKVRVKGNGFDPAVGIYVAFCVDQGPSSAPTPCFGGADQSGTSGGSHWISSNPPSYGAGISQPYGAGGSFDVELDISSQDGSVNCLDGSTRCVVATRADHTAPSNRSADVKVPVYFVGQNPSAVVLHASTAQPTQSSPRFTG